MFPHLERTRFGRLRLTEPRPGVLLVRASGYVGPRLLRRDVAVASRFARSRPAGWAYVVDTGGVRLANPLNVAVLRRVRSLDGLGAWLVIVRPRRLRPVVRLLGRLVGVDAVVADLDEALARAGGGPGDVRLPRCG
ncbi:MAG: hypothetical protein S0880_03625 [Actinomycetota bacterium]|nr:hypothetical protein [Actinomycetota bacterium]